MVAIIQLKKILQIPFSILRKITWKYHSLRFGRLGKDSKISRHIWLINPRNIFIGKSCFIGPYSRLETYSNYGNIKTNPVLNIGDNCSIQHAVHIYCVHSVEIQKGCLIASGCMITDNNHGIDPEGDHYGCQPLNARPTLIKEEVWLGENVCVLSGSIIGKRSIIGSNSTVKGEIPDYSIAIGNPAKVVKTYNFNTRKWEKLPNEYNYAE